MKFNLILVLTLVLTLSYNNITAKEIYTSSGITLESVQPVHKGDKLKSLEEHNESVQKRMEDINQPMPNGIACPKCGHELYDSTPMVVLTSNPSQYNVHCPVCGYTGYRY